ncbi:protein kinase C-like 1B [Octopus sinensis]|uniref:Protein kinase C-like 1B n=1 Tax=Octopus sinensis TaxID=2607531 RepID=A0A6P7TTM8_9MOLL|nr:protein kinase C-like 1B [Octopus sinensis]
MFNGLATIEIFCAADLQKTDFSKRHSIVSKKNSVVSAYVTVDVDGIVVFKTQVCQKSNNPAWNETCTFMILHGNALRFILFDKGIQNDTYIADLTLDIGKAVEKEWVSIIALNLDCTQPVRKSVHRSAL